MTPDGLEVELADAPAIEQVRKAMVEFRHQQHDAPLLGLGSRRVQLMPRRSAKRREAALQRIEIALAGDRIEHDTHEEPVGLRVVVLLGVENVEARIRQMPRHGSDDTGTVRAGERQDEALRRGRSHDRVLEFSFRTAPRGRA